MKIEMNSASYFTNVSYSNSNQNSSSINTPIETNSSTVNIQPVQDTATKSDNYTGLLQKPKQELTIDEKTWVDMIERANKKIEGSMCSFEFSIHDRTKQIMVKVIDQDTKEVIREIPPEKVLDMVAHMWELAGIIVDERR